MNNLYIEYKSKEVWGGDGTRASYFFFFTKDPNFVPVFYVIFISPGAGPRSLSRGALLSTEMNKNSFEFIKLCKCKVVEVWIYPYTLEVSNQLKTSCYLTGINS